MFSRHTIVFSYIETNKKARVKKVLFILIYTYLYHLYLFSLRFGNSHPWVPIKSNDYCDGVSAKLMYLNSCDYIFNTVHFIISLDDSHFGSRGNMPASHQNSQTSKEIGANISIFFGSSLLCWHILQKLSIFVTNSIFNLLKSVF